MANKVSSVLKRDLKYREKQSFNSDCSQNTAKSMISDRKVEGICAISCALQMIRPTPGAIATIPRSL